MWQKPIFDRTYTDAKTARDNQSNIDNHKGAMNAQDLNRVEGNYLWLLENLFKNTTPIPHTKRNRVETTYEAADGPLGTYTLINMLPPVEQWPSAGFPVNNGVFEFLAGGHYVTQIEMPAPTVNHKYYGRCIQRSSPGFTSGDGRFEYWVGDGGQRTMVFANSATNTHDDTWHMNSEIHSVTVLESPSGWLFRNFIVNGSSTFYRKEPLMVDLTAAFGEGNEPSKEWCDQHIPYFVGAYTFTNVERAVTKTFTDWQEQNIPWQSEIDRIRNNFNNLVRHFLHGLDLPLFYSSAYLMYEEVNDWERVLSVGKEMYTNMQNEFRRCNAYECGGSDVDWMPYEKNPVHSAVLGVGVLGKLMIGKEE